MRRAVHFGAGNIGRGFLGQLYFESGYATTFIDVDRALIDGLNARRGYPVRIVSDAVRDVAVSHVDAVDGADREAAARALAAADIASTAVGGRVLPHIAPAIAAGIALRFARADAPPLDIVVCENLLHAGPHLRALVRAHLPAALHDALGARVGFVEASVGRMVPVTTASQRAEDPLRVCVEPYCELPVDAEAFKGPIPAIAHLVPKPRFGAYVERKLFVHNLSHAAAAYLGALRGHAYIWQAIGDARVRAAVEAAMRQSCAGLHARHGLPVEELEAHCADLLGRYANRALADRVARVAADPMRKLGRDDRLIGAARMCEAQGLPFDAIAFAAAAAIRYDNPNDPGTISLRSIHAAQGPGGVIRAVCGVDPGGALGRAIAAAGERLAREGWLEGGAHA